MLAKDAIEGGKGAEAAGAGDPENVFATFAKSAHGQEDTPAGKPFGECGAEAGEEELGQLLGDDPNASRDGANIEERVGAVTLGKFHGKRDDIGKGDALTGQLVALGDGSDGRGDGVKDGAVAVHLGAGNAAGLLREAGQLQESDGAAMSDDGGDKVESAAGTDRARCGGVFDGLGTEAGVELDASLEPGAACGKNVRTGNAIVGMKDEVGWHGRQGVRQPQLETCRGAKAVKTPPDFGILAQTVVNDPWAGNPPF